MQFICTAHTISQARASFKGCQAKLNEGWMAGQMEKFNINANLVRKAVKSVYGPQKNIGASIIAGLSDCLKKKQKVETAQMKKQTQRQKREVQGVRSVRVLWHLTQLIRMLTPRSHKPTPAVVVVGTPKDARRNGTLKSIISVGLLVLLLHFGIIMVA